MTVQDTLKLPRTPRLSPQATRAVQVDQPPHHPWNRDGCRDSWVLAVLTLETEIGAES